MENRETKTIITPIEKHTVVIKSYLIGRELRDIANASIPKKVNYNGNSGGIDDIDLVDFSNQGENAGINNTVVSVDGKSDIDFVSALLDMHGFDTKFVLDEIKKVIDGLPEEKKTI